ncbi:hypothetical protein CPB83DRAFT_894630 [Crepidotus variabilis]|uniref:Aminoglycoside phosphotransferase domain-containing protein n=1 Tax=Crepidotus variabilis TaxID=179855 RepID=A0A9P6EG58_9AGAR|nr:hypothetical protein CPB83DRAFT_894630 [Crepidotus variabilis]
MHVENTPGPSIFNQQLFPDRWLEQAQAWHILAEQDILLNQKFHTGANITALAFAASFALTIPQPPTISFLARGGFNQIIRGISRVPQTVATTTFARYVLGIPTPRILAWNADESNPACTPYIIQEFIDSAVDCCKAFCEGNEDERMRILEDLADWHARFLQLPPPISSGFEYGDLEFAPGLLDDANPAKSNCYCIQPIIRPSEACGETYGNGRNCGNGEYLDKEGLHVNDGDAESDALVSLESFKDVAERVRLFSKEAIHTLTNHPVLGLPCLVQEDFAFSNILLDPVTLKIKAFLDLDDVHDLPFVMGINYPEEISIADAQGLPVGSLSIREGDFGRDFPPSAYDDPLRAFDQKGNLRG